MALKILYQDIFPERIPDITSEHESLWDFLKAHACKVLGPEAEVVLSHVDKLAKYETLPYFERLNDLQIVNKIIDAERSGFDAAVIGCINDPGLKEARGAVDIPVTSVFESALILAQVVGHRFACIGMSSRVIPVALQNLRSYGLMEKMIPHKPIRFFELDFARFIDFIKGRDDGLIGEFQRVAAECVQDGADVVIPAHGYLGPALTMRGIKEVEGAGVPIVDGNAAALKLAETLVDLQRAIGLAKSKARISPYRTPPREVVDRIRADFGF